MASQAEGIGGLLNGYFDEVSWAPVMAWSDVVFLLSAAT